MNKKLWTKDYTLFILATIMGSVGGVASGFALSFLVFDETGSTLASAFLLAMQLVPAFIVPLIAAPVMDRFPRKPFLVAGDAINGLLYALAGFYLLHFEFNYVGYLCFSLLLSTLGSFDSMAYNALYPNLIPKGCEQKGFAVSGTLYPMVTVIMTPVAAVLYEAVGVGMILLLQGGLSIAAAITESFVKVEETDRRHGEKFSLKMWWNDIRAAVDYLRGEEGLKAIYAYMAVTNGVGNGYGPLLVAFFRTAPGFSVVMYSAFSVAEFAGRTLGGLFHYNVEIPRKKRFAFAFGTYQFYELMDMILLWVSYPLMLVNRFVCGFLGVNSASLREAAVQRYIPDEHRAKLNAFLDMIVSLTVSLFALLMGALGEVMDYRWCITLSAFVTAATCWLTIWRKRKNVRNIYQREWEQEEA